MKKKWIYRAAAVFMVMMLASGSMADEIQQDAEQPVVQTEAPSEASTEVPTEAPVSMPAQEPAPSAQSEAPDETELPSETMTAKATDVPEEPADAEAPTEAPTETPAEAPTEVPVETPATVEGQPEETPAAGEATPDCSDTPSADPSLSPSPETPVIAGFAALSMTETVLTEKPALEKVLSVLPSALDAVLTDGTAVSAAVYWTCANYEAEAAEYVFAASLKESVYALGEGVSMPTFTLRIQTDSVVVSGEFMFVKNDQGQLMLTGWSGESSSVCVPDTVEGMPMVAVAKSAFAGRNGLRELMISDGIVAIESGAFENCVNLTRVSLPDSIEVAGDLFGGCGALTVLQLEISGETAISDARGYTRRIIEMDESGNQTVREVSVRLDRAFTDYRVLSGGKWRVDGAIKIDAGHGISVVGDGALYITASGAVTVNGTMSNAGAALNEGRIIACGGSVAGMNGTIVTDHSYEGGVCAICGARQALTQTLTVSPVSSVIEKTYDGSSGLNLGANDFVLEGVRSGDEVYIAVINTSFNESNAGSYLASVSFQLGGADASNYTALPMELGVVIR